MDAIEKQSLEQHENVIDAWVKEKDAAVIYWHHGQKIWAYLLVCDEEIINGEMNKLVNLIRAGMIVCVKKGLVVDVKGTQHLNSRICYAQPILWLQKGGSLITYT